MLLVPFSILISFSAFFSGSETAILSLDLYRVSSDASDGNPVAKRLLHYLDNPEVFLSIVLLGNTLSNIAAASIFTLWLSQFKSDAIILGGTVGLTIFVLLFCEILPKSIAARHSYSFSKTVLPILGLFEMIMFPILKPLNWFSRLYMRPSKDQLNNQQMRRIVRTASQQLPVKERIMLDGVLSICTATVESLMIPIHMVAIIEPQNVDTLLNSQHQNILIAHQKQVDSILGILTEHDRKRLNAHPSKDDLLRHLTPPHYILEGTLVSKQLENFQLYRNRVSIIIDEYGHPLGLLDLGDILDELLGNYAQNSLYPLGQIKQTAQGSIYAKSFTRVREINQLFNLMLPTNRAQTIGGLVIDCLRSIPDGPCSVIIGKHRFDVQSIQQHQIEWIEIFPSDLLQEDD
jgi:Mg2+/Co2+ transporter CorB